MRFVLVLAAALGLGPASSFGGELAGKPAVVDGDTIAIGDATIDLFGIEAPPDGQLCTRNGAHRDCGREASFALAFLLAEHWVACQPLAQPAAGAVTAVCRAGPLDIGEAMVRRGWAVARPGSAPAYRAAQAEARAAGRGMWRDKR